MAKSMWTGVFWPYILCVKYNCTVLIHMINCTTVACYNSETGRERQRGQDLALKHLTAARVPAEKYGCRPWHWSLRF